MYGADRAREEPHPCIWSPIRGMAGWSPEGVKPGSPWGGTVLQIATAPWPGKPGRCLYRLGPVADAAYRGAVAALVPTIEAGLHPWVVGNRVARARPLTLEGWGGARARYRELVVSHVARAGASLRVDVADCFRSIRPSVVGEGLDSLGAPTWERARVVAQLEVLAAHGVPGLPAGPAASAVLANAVLARADRALLDLGLPWVRWVDDIIVFGGAGDLFDAERAIGDAVATLGLSLHPGKRATALGSRECLRLALGRASAARLARHADPLPGTAHPDPRRPPGRLDPRGRPADRGRRQR